MVIYLIITAVVMILMMAWATFLFGRVEGTEFSPETLTRRRFGYYELPIFGLQVSPLDRTPLASNMEQFLLKNKYATPIKPEKWDLIAGAQGAVTVNPRGASILCAYFDALDNASQPYWLGWSQNHPQLAAILWPEVITVARLRRYELIPDMMHLALLADEKQPQKFQTELQQQMVDQSMKLANWFQPIDANRARELYQLVLSKDPKRADAQQALQSLPSTESKGR